MWCCLATGARTSTLMAQSESATCALLPALDMADERKQWSERTLVTRSSPGKAIAFGQHQVAFLIRLWAQVCDVSKC